MMSPEPRYCSVHGGYCRCEWNERCDYEPTCSECDVELRDGHADWCPRFRPPPLKGETTEEYKP